MKDLKNEEEKNKSSKDPSSKEANEQDEDHLLTEIRKQLEKPDLVWTELIRLIRTTNKKFDFQPLDEHISKIIEKLGGCTPETYSSMMTYDEKLEILEVLVDGIHDLDEFRQFLN